MTRGNWYDHATMKNFGPHGLISTSGHAGFSLAAGLLLLGVSLAPAAAQSSPARQLPQPSIDLALPVPPKALVYHYAVIDAQGQGGVQAGPLTNTTKLELSLALPERTPECRKDDPMGPMIVQVRTSGPASTGIRCAALPLAERRGAWRAVEGAASPTPLNTWRPVAVFRPAGAPPDRWLIAAVRFESVGIRESRPLPPERAQLLKDPALRNLLKN